MRAIFAAAFMAGVLAAGSAEACRSAAYQQELLFTDLPPLEPRDALVLEVEIRRVDVRTGYAWARVKAVRVGAFRGRDVRIELHTTSCGPFPQRGDRGLLIGRLETAGDGRPVFIAQLDSPARRKDRQKDRP